MRSSYVNLHRVILLLLAMITPGCSSNAVLVTDLPPTRLATMKPAPSVPPPTAPPAPTLTSAPVASPTLPSSPTTGIGPLYPTFIRTMPMETGGVRLVWNGTGETGIIAYRIYREENDGEPQPIGTAPTSGDNRGRYQYEDHTATKVGLYRYYVAAIDQTGTEGQLSGPSTITIGP